MQFRLLGPFEVCAGARPIRISGSKPRAVLAVLLLRAGQAVSAEQLAQSLWGEDAPRGATRTVQVHVSRLRRDLGDPGWLERAAAGYRVTLEPEQLDLARFERLLEAGRQALDAREHERAAGLLRDALALWRGPPLAEFADLPFAPAEIERLEERHLEAVSLRMQAELALGRHAQLVAELRELTKRHPWHEQSHAQLMLALYRSGRQAEALEAYQHARSDLVDALGLEPGRELSELHQQILAHDPTLAAPTPVPHASRGVPAPPNRTIGRAGELETVTEQLRGTRLLTLTGPGGVGKTRLALEAARAADDACFVSLAALTQPAEVPTAILQAAGVSPVFGETGEQALQRAFAARTTLVVLDNFEHLLGAAELIADWLAACPAITVLATSREPLGLHAETCHPVPPLDADSDAVTLFGERARARAPDADLADERAVAALCRRLDGLPLAIELAASRCAMLSPAEIAQRLDAAFVVLGPGPRDAPARQRTLHATVEWSHSLLTAEDRTAFARFAVFAGGATIDAAQRVTGADLDTLNSLVAKSLLLRRRGAEGATRLAMLETIRSYAAQRFADDPDEQLVRARHYRHFLGVARRHGSEQVLWRLERGAHLAALDDDLDNLRAALHWATAGGAPAIQLTGALAAYWLTRAHYREALDWIDRACAQPVSDAHVAELVTSLRVKVWCLWPIGRAGEQRAVLRELEATARRSGDPLLISQALTTIADHALTIDASPASGVTAADEAVHWALTSGERWQIASATRMRARAAFFAPDLADRVDHAATLLEAVDNPHELADLFTSAAYAALCDGDDELAHDLLERAHPILRALQNPFMWMIARGKAGLVALFRRELTEAESAFREELELSRSLAFPPIASEGLLGLAAIAAARHDPVRAACLSGAALATPHGIRQDHIQRRIEACFFAPARPLLGEDGWEAALRSGRELGLDAAIAYGLEGAPRPAATR